MKTQIVPKIVVMMAESLEKKENVIFTGMRAGKTWAMRIAAAKKAKAAKKSEKRI